MKAFVQNVSVRRPKGEFPTISIDLVVADLNEDVDDVFSHIKQGMVLDQLTVRDPTVDIGAVLAGKPKRSIVKVFLPGRKLCLD